MTRGRARLGAVSRRTFVVALFAVAASALTQCAHAQPSSDAVRVPILVYHSIAPHHPGQTVEQRQMDVDTAVFREQMSYLTSHGYEVISFDALVDALQGRGSPPDRAVVLTFDDGWETQYETAYPILRDLGLTATFFIYSTAIANGPAFMTWDQIREIQHAGMTIGAHSRTHPVLTGANVDLRSEIVGSRDDIEQHLGSAPNLFAYPYGEWDTRVADVVRGAGFRAARAFGGVSNTTADLFALKAVMITDDMAAFERTVSRQ
jgi:peptidoglycan/xylan/chitin deacetylase (PgdA/CDA1 family)